MKVIRGGRGLGDAMYVRPVADYFVKAGEQVRVQCDYPDVFIGSGAAVEPFRRDGVNVLAHYTAGKYNPATNQWQDVCASAGVPELPLRFDWEIKNHALVDKLRADAGGDPIIVVHGGRTPMGRKDLYGAELLPKKSAFDAALGVFADCYTVLIGGDAQLYPIHTEADLIGKTSVSDLLDIGSICDGIVAQCSFCVPLAEVFDKPLLAIWAAAGMAEGIHRYLRAITPKKILSKPTSHHVIDDWGVQKIQNAARDFRCVPLEVAA